MKNLEYGNDQPHARPGCDSPSLVSAARTEPVCPTPRGRPSSAHSLEPLQRSTASCPPLSCCASPCSPIHCLQSILKRTLPDLGAALMCITTEHKQQQRSTWLARSTSAGDDRQSRPAKLKAPTAGSSISLPGAEQATCEQAAAVPAADHLEGGASVLAYGTSVSRGACCATSSTRIVLVLRCVCTKILSPTTAA